MLGMPERFELVPDKNPARGENAAARAEKRRRAEDDRIVAIEHALDHRDRRRSRAAAVVTGHFAEGSFDLRAFVGRQHLAFEHDFGRRRGSASRSSRPWSLPPARRASSRQNHTPTRPNLDWCRRFRTVPVPDRAISPIGHDLSLGPIFFADHVAVMTGTDVRDDVVFAEQHVAIGADVDVTGVGIARHRRRSRRYTDRRRAGASAARETS